MTNIDYIFDGCNKLKNIPNKFKNIIRIIIDENLKEYNYNEKLKMNEQDYNNKFHLELELKNGIGKVIEFDKEGEKLFEGEYLNGEPSKNKIYNNDNIIINIKNGNNQIEARRLFGQLLFD